MDRYQWVYFVPDVLFGERVLIGAWVPGAKPQPFIRASVMPWGERALGGTLQTLLRRLEGSEELDLRALGNHVALSAWGELPCEPAQAREWFAQKLARRFGAPVAASDSALPLAAERPKEVAEVAEARAAS